MFPGFVPLSVGASGANAAYPGGLPVSPGFPGSPSPAIAPLVNPFGPVLQIGPASQVVELKGRRFTVHSHQEQKDKLEWAQLQVLSMREKVLAALMPVDLKADEDLPDDEETSLKAKLRRLLRVTIYMVAKALRTEDFEFCANLSDPEQLEVIALQDRLNNMGSLYEAMHMQDIVRGAYLEARQGLPADTVPDLEGLSLAGPTSSWKDLQEAMAGIDQRLPPLYAPNQGHSVGGAQFPQVDVHSDERPDPDVAAHADGSAS